MRASKRPARRKTGKTTQAKTTHAARKPRSKRPIAPPAKRYSIGGGAVLALAIGALTVLAGSALYVADFNKADALTQSGQAAIEIKLEPQQVAVPAAADNHAELVDIPPVQENQVAGDTAAGPAPVLEPARQASPERIEPAVVPAPVKKEKVHRASQTPAPAASPPETGTVAFASTNSLIAEARRYLGTNPTGRASLWCGAFLDMVLKRTGRRGGGNLATGYTHYGRRISGPQVGAIVVLGRQGGGHVGIVTGIDSNGNPIVISGNHNRRVAEAVYPRSRVIAYVAADGT